ncbi:MAG: proprotein convertase P-domain-containing protein [Verrucomicrobiota bacterium]
MRRLLVSAAVLLAVTAGPSRAATKTYSTGNIDVPIGTSLDRSLAVSDRGPVSFVRVSFRITAPDTAALAVSLVSPKGTEVPLVVHRGSGADFGSEQASCGGTLTVLDSDETTNPIAAGSSPFTDTPYRPEGSLSSLYGQDAHGRWTLRITNSGRPARLRCLTLDISRDVPQSLSAHGRDVKATISYTERDFLYEKLRLTIVRSGRTALDVPIQRVACPDCAGSRPVGVAVRDLDGGQPEVMFDLYTGGAHCCSVSLILRWDPAARRYRSTFAYWGNYGRRLVDLDHDGLPEFSAFDERFVYEYSAYVFSSAPIRVVQYRRGALVGVTRKFPDAIGKNAALNLGYYLKGRRDIKSVDVRSFVAAYVADEYLLGAPAQAKRVLELALKRGDLGRGKTLLGWPAGKAFVGKLMRDLKRWGYIRGS